MEDEAEETFESTDAGASHTYPMEAGQVRKGGFIMIKGNPCKVSDVSTSKTGKHGHAKCHFVAIDIFTGKKMEDLVPSSHTTSVPFVKKEEFQCMCVSHRLLSFLPPSLRRLRLSPSPRRARTGALRTEALPFFFPSR